MNIVQRILRSLGVDKGLAYVTFGNFLYTSLGAVLWFYLTSILAANVYGKLNYDIAIATVLTAIGIMGFDTTLTTFVAKGASRMFPQAALLILHQVAFYQFYLHFHTHSHGHWCFFFFLEC